MILFKKYSQYLFLLVALFGFKTLLSQDSLVQAPITKTWHYRVEPYMMFPNMNGSTGVAALPLVDVNASASDIFSKLKMGAMLFLEASNGNWSVNSDLLFMNLEQHATPSTILNSGKVNAKQLGWELAGLKRVTPWLEFGIGALLNSLEMDLNISRNQVGGGTLSQSGNQSKTWLDPMLIARLNTPANKKFIGQFRGEVGGFGIGSDFSWQVQAIAGYRFSKLFDLTAGYRAIGLDYNAGDGAKTFVYDMVTFGPMLRFGFSF
jgi:hypothetical protein